MKFLLKLLISALGVLLAAYWVPGIAVAGFWTAVLVAIVFGILNATLGFVIKILTLPLSLVTFGLFWLVVNALMFWLASFIKGFSVAGFWPAFFGALIVTAVNLTGRIMLRERQV